MRSSGGTSATAQTPQAMPTAGPTIHSTSMTQPNAVRSRSRRSIESVISTLLNRLDAVARLRDLACGNGQLQEWPFVPFGVGLVAKTAIDRAAIGVKLALDIGKRFLNFVGRGAFFDAAKVFLEQALQFGDFHLGMGVRTIPPLR